MSPSLIPGAAAWVVSGVRKAEPIIITVVVSEVVTEKAFKKLFFVSELRVIIN
jgi:hypothetical protein